MKKIILSFGLIVFSTPAFASNIADQFIKLNLTSEFSTNIEEKSAVDYDDISIPYLLKLANNDDQKAQNLFLNKLEKGIISVFFISDSDLRYSLDFEKWTQIKKGPPFSEMVQFLMIVKSLIEDYPDILEQIKKEAELGIAASQFQYSLTLHEDSDEKTSYEAATWLTKAAENNYMLAQYLLGLIHQKDNNIQESIKWFKLAADRGYVDAMFQLAEIYDNKKMGFKNKNKSKKYYIKAAENGHHKAQFNLGNLYLQDPNNNDFHLAFRSYEKYAKNVGTSIHELLAHYHLKNYISSYNIEGIYFEEFYPTIDEPDYNTQFKLAKIFANPQTQYVNFKCAANFYLSAAKYFHQQHFPFEKLDIFERILSAKISNDLHKDQKDLEQLKTITQIFMNIHSKEAEVNKSYISDVKNIFAISSMYKKLVYLVEYENKILETLSFFNKPGFMINAFTIKNFNENSVDANTMPFYYRCSIGNYNVLSILSDNANAAQGLNGASLFLGKRIPKITAKLIKIYEDLIHHYEVKALKQQQKARYLGQSDQKVEDYNKLITETKGLLKSIKMVAKLPSMVEELIIQHAPARNKRFVDEYPFLLD